MYKFFESLINPYPSETPNQPPNTLFAFIWHYARPIWPIIAFMSVSVALVAIVEVSFIGFMGSIMDWLSEADRETFFADEWGKLLFMALIALIVLPLLSLAVQLIVHQGIMGNFGMIIRWQMHRYLLRQSMSFFSDEFAGRVATKVMQTSLAMRDVILIMLEVMVYVCVYFFGGLLMIMTFHWMLVIPFVIWLGLYSIMLRLLLPKMMNIARNQADARSEMTGRVVDSYTNIATVKLFAHTKREEDYARSAMDGFLQTVYPQMRLSTTLEMLVQMLNSFLLVSSCGVGIWLWQQGQSGAGAIAVVMGLTIRLGGMSHWIMWELTRLFESIGVVQDGMNMMSKAYLVQDKPEAKELDATGKPIHFKDIEFTYGEEGHVIDGLDLKLEAGQKIGLVGRSGAGKTTLTNLLLRFYDLEGGQILIGDEDISDAYQDSLRANIGMVTQDTSLLHRSIRENIAYSSPEATDKQIIEAAKKANAWEFIETLVDSEGNKGLDAQVGERGVKLSGGQRQRIAIARIFLKNAPILVLDEATSALDSAVEAAIQENLFELMDGKTVIAIAHRLSTIAQLDLLVVMEDGKIAEAGTHQKLIDEGGIYADLWTRQSGGFLPTMDKKQGSEAEAAGVIHGRNKFHPQFL